MIWGVESGSGLGCAASERRPARCVGGARCHFGCREAASASASAEEPAATARLLRASARHLRLGLPGGFFRHRDCGSNCRLSRRPSTWCEAAGAAWRVSWGAAARSHRVRSSIGRHSGRAAVRCGTARPRPSQTPAQFESVAGYCPFGRVIRPVGAHETTATCRRPITPELRCYSAICSARGASQCWCFYSRFVYYCSTSRSTTEPSRETASRTGSGFISCINNCKINVRPLRLS